MDISKNQSERSGHEGKGPIEENATPSEPQPTVVSLDNTVSYFTEKLVVPPVQSTEPHSEQVGHVPPAPPQGSTTSLAELPSRPFLDTYPESMGYRNTYAGPAPECDYCGPPPECDYCGPPPECDCDCPAPECDDPDPDDFDHQPGRSGYGSSERQDSGLHAESLVRGHDVRDESSETGEAPPASSSSSASEYLQTAFTSSAIWSGAGAAVFCLESSLLAVFGHLAVGWQTLRNEVGIKRGAAAEPSVDAQTGTAVPGYPGYHGLVADTLKSPAFNTIATGLCYLAASAQCVASGQLFEGSILATYFCGLMAMSNAIGASYAGTRTTQTLAERGFRAAWAAIPERMQTFLKNPSVWLAAGNLPLVAVACNLGDIAANPLVTTPALVGLMLSEFGLVSAVKTLLWGTGTSASTQQTSVDERVGKRQEAASFSQGLLLNSAGHLLVGASSLMQGALYIGAAKVCWCIACGILGLQKRAEALAPDNR